jgi:uncharacterized damage-inducible protein DinB
MLLDYIKLLYAYHHWANERIMRSVQRVDPTQATESTHGGYARIHETLVHMVGAEAIWRSRWQEVAPSPRPTLDDLPTLLSVQQRWQDEEHQIQLFIDSLQEDDLAAPLTYTDLRGQPVTWPLAATLLQVSTHGTQHRSEVALWLTELGYSPGDLDLLRYLQERAATP